MTSSSTSKAAPGITSHLTAPARLLSLSRRESAASAISRHWPEYLMEAAGLGAFMMSACLFTLLIEHPDSPVRQATDSAIVRRLLTGIAMGLTAIAIIYSPWGKRSGAHINPAVTLTFFRLGKVKSWDALFYTASQFIGATAGVAICALVLGQALAHPEVNYAATVPGPTGVLVAAVAEFVISAGLMTMILFTTRHARLSRYTGLIAGTLVLLYITLESPLSGMSMNPARTFGSAFSAGVWTSFAVYLLAPLAGMLAAAQGHLWWSDRTNGCAKLQHNTSQRCIFCGANGGFA